MSVGRVNVAYRYWFVARLGNGAPATGIAAIDVTVTVRDPTDTNTSNPAITEFGGGLYYFDIPAAFTLANGAGEYGVSIEINSTTPRVRDMAGETIPFFNNLFDQLAVPGDAMALTAGERTTLAGVVDTTLSASHGAGSWNGTTPAAVSAAVWAEALPGAFIAGSAGFILGTNLDALVSSRATQAQILSDATPFAGANVDAAITSRSSHSAADVDTVLTAAHGAGSWNGTTPGAVAAAVWSEALPAAFGAGSAGFILGTNLDATISSVNTAIGALNDISALDVWNLDLDANFTVAQRNRAGGALLLERMMTTNRLEEASGTPGTVVLYDDAGTAVELTWEIRPETGNTIGEILGSPARRAEAT